jgi:hypothetical protein
MSTENEDLSESLAAELTGSVGMDDTGEGMSDALAADLAGQEQHLAEKNIPVSDDVQDTAQGELDREAEQDAERHSKRKVPLAALHEERSKRQALELQLQAQAQQLQQLQAQWQATQQAQQQAAEQAAIPDFDEDPRGYIEAKERQFAQALDQLQNGPAQQQQAALQQQQVTAAVVNLEQQFMAAVPDYEQAVDLVQRNADAQIRQLYPQATEEQFQMIRSTALGEFARQCLMSGANPAEKIYAKAQALGFKTSGQMSRREPPTSLGNLSGSARAPDEKGAVSASDISSMSEAEFDKYWAGLKSGSAIGPAF